MTEPYIYSIGEKRKTNKEDLSTKIKESEDKVMIEIENLKQVREVTITQHRYEELLDIETRVDVVVEKIIREKYMGMEDILRTLGTELALQGAEEIRSGQ